MKLNTSVSFDKAKIISSLESFWKRTYKLLFFSLLACVIFFGAYVWNQNLYSSIWSPQQSQDFMDTQDKGIIFNENNYKKALEIIKQRSDENVKQVDAGKDFFLPY